MPVLQLVPATPLSCDGAKTMPPRNTEPRFFNANSILMSILMGLSIWTVTSVNEYGKKIAALVEQVRALERTVFTKP